MTKRLGPLITLAILTTCQWLSAQEIEWLSWEEAVRLTQTEARPKKVFVDVYTDWCGYCKRMDAQTFNDPEVARYMKENFYMVKFNAEQKEPIEFQGRTFNYVARGNRGYHELAVLLLNGRLSYPTVVFMNEEMTAGTPVPGFRPADTFLPIAEYFVENGIQASGPRKVKSGSKR